jgi:hypothetical protein
MSFLRWLTGPRFAQAPADAAAGGGAEEVEEVVETDDADADEAPDDAAAKAEAAKKAETDAKAKADADAKKKGEKEPKPKPAAEKKTLLGKSEKPADAAAKAEADKAAKEKAAKDGKGAAESELDAWTPKLADGQKVDEELLGELKVLGKAHGLKGEALQGVVELGGKLQEKAVQALVGAHEALVEGWAKDAKADKEIGGGKLEETLQAGLGALRRFSGADFPAVVAELERTGLGSHPAMIRMLAKIDKATREDDTPERIRGGKGGAKSADGQKAIHDKLYPKMAKELARERGEDTDDE